MWRSKSSDDSLISFPQRRALCAIDVRNSSKSVRIASGTRRKIHTVYLKDRRLAFYQDRRRASLLSQRISFCRRCEIVSPVFSLPLWELLCIHLRRYNPEWKHTLIFFAKSFFFRKKRFLFIYFSGSTALHPRFRHTS